MKTVRITNILTYLLLILQSTVVVTNLVFAQFQYLDITPTQNLYVTVTTDKPTYGYRESVSVSGNVITLNGIPVEKGLAAIQLENPAGNTIALRIAPIGTIPSVQWTVEIVSIITCDSDGNPKDAFAKKTTAWFKATVRNNNPASSRSVLLTVSIYDNDLTPMVVCFTQLNLEPNGVAIFMADFFIDEWVPTGNALICANVFTDWPKNQGYPYSPEKSASFTIIEKATSAYSNQETSEDRKNIEVQSNSSIGMFKGTFRIKPYVAPYSGTYSISVSVLSLDNFWKGFQNTAFKVEYEVPQDFNLNHEIDIYDVVKVTKSYGTKGGDPNWDPRADLDTNGKIEIYDVVKVTGIYGTTY